MQCSSGVSRLGTNRPAGPPGQRALSYDGPSAAEQPEIFQAEAKTKRRVRVYLRRRMPRSFKHSVIHPTWFKGNNSINFDYIIFSSINVKKISTINQILRQELLSGLVKKVSKM